jgi:hypothetical protein
VVDPGIIVAIPFGLRLVAMDLDQRTVDVELDAGQSPAASLGSDTATGSNISPMRACDVAVFLSSRLNLHHFQAHATHPLRFR